MKKYAIMDDYDVRKPIVPLAATSSPPLPHCSLSHIYQRDHEKWRPSTPIHSARWRKWASCANT